MVKHKTQLVKTKLAPTTTFSDFHVWISVFTLPLECCFIVCLFVCLFSMLLSAEITSVIVILCGGSGDLVVTVLNSGFEDLERSVCCVLGQNTKLS